MPPTLRTIRADGHAIRRLRETLGMSQTALAQAVGFTTQGHLSRIEAGKAQPSPAALRQIADTLGVDVAAISTPVEDAA